MAHMNIFQDDAFSVVNLTTLVNEAPYKPGRIMGMGLFAEEGVRTTAVSIESMASTIGVVQTTPRGAPAPQITPDKRKLRMVGIPHLALGDTITAEEVQGIRAFGSESELDSVVAEVNRRNVKLRNHIELTKERHLLGALQGLVLDADGSTLFDMFAFMGVTQDAEIDFDLDNAAPAAGALRKKVMAMHRKMTVYLGGTPMSGCHAFCGDAFFDDLISHPEVKAAYETQAANRISAAGNLAWSSVEFAGVTWENYRGTDDGTTVSVGTDKAIFFPTGAPIYNIFYAPADTMDLVNTVGLPFYAMSAPDLRFGKYVELEVQSNMLPLVTKPRALFKGRRT